MGASTLLAGDIGGTNSRLSLWEVRGAAVEMIHSATYASQSARGLEELVERFLAEGPKATLIAAALAVAGPVIDGRSVTTNLPWVLEEGALAQVARVAQLRLLNDLQALAFGVLFVGPDQQVSLNGISPPGRGNAAVIAVGTGLGEAYLHWDGARYHPSPSEGSHGEFGPRNELQIELSRFLIQRFGHPSTERVVSGPGFSVLYDFLLERGEKPPPELVEELAHGDRNAIISEHGLSGRHAICAHVMELFIDAFGAEAGNMALRGMATGGVFVGGGVAPRILAKLRDGRFTAAFEDKGRFREMLSRVPLSVVLHDHAGLLGAAHFARLMG